MFGGHIPQCVANLLPALCGVVSDSIHRYLLFWGLTLEFQHRKDVLNSLSCLSGLIFKIVLEESRLLQKIRPIFLNNTEEVHDEILNEK